MSIVLILAAIVGLLTGAEKFESVEWRLPAGIHRTPRSFRAVGVYANHEVRLRASADGIAWSDWQTAHPDPDGELIYFGEPQQFLETDSAAPFRTLLIDAGETTRPLSRKAPQRSAATPDVIKREQWGCTPASCPAKDPPSYTSVTHLIVHHSAGSNTAADWAAVVRSIWVLHVNGNGWNDIGYNYLIDPNGLLYEGRAGGDGVLGAHFSGVNTGTMGVCLLGTYSTLAPRAPSIDTLRDLLLWQARRWNVDPGGRSLHAASGLILNNISGHRDAGLSPRATSTTECPGNGVYTLLPSLRDEVRRLIEGDCPLTIERRYRCTAADASAIEIQASTPEGCPLNVESRSEWIRATLDGSTLKLDLQANPGVARSGAVLVNGQRIDINQATAGAPAQPCIDFNGVVNAATFDTRPLAPGSLFTIFGENLAGVATAVTINSRPATVLYVSPNQINAQLPATDIGSARIVVNRDGTPSPERLISITEAAPAIFAVMRDQPEQLSVFYTGGGRNTSPPTARIGTTPATLINYGSVPTLAGVEQATFRIPANLSGDVTLTIAGSDSPPAPIP